jgi:hypothetical protein
MVVRVPYERVHQGRVQPRNTGSVGPNVHERGFVVGRAVRSVSEQFACDEGDVRTPLVQPRDANSESETSEEVVLQGGKRAVGRGKETKVGA